MGEIDPIEGASDKIKSALLIQHVPEKYLLGLHRLLMILCETTDSYAFDPYDLTPLISELVDGDEIDPDFTTDCIAVGSEFEIISVKRDSVGRINLVDVGLYSVPFLAAIIGDYDCALECAIRVNSRYAETADKYDPTAAAALSLFGHWSAVGIAAIEATVEPTDKTLINAFRESLSGQLDGFVEDSERSSWLTSKAVQRSLEKLHAVNLIEHQGEKYTVNKASAIRFLTAVGEFDLLTKIQSR